MKIDQQELATRFTDRLLAAGWTRYHGDRFRTAWARPDGTRAQMYDVYMFLRTTEPDAFRLSQYVAQKMAAYADTPPSPHA